MKIENIHMSLNFEDCLKNHQTIYDVNGIKYFVEDVVKTRNGIKCSLTTIPTPTEELIKKLKEFNTPVKTLSGEALEILNKTFKRHFKQIPTRL